MGGGRVKEKVNQKRGVSKVGEVDYNTLFLNILPHPLLLPLYPLKTNPTKSFKNQTPPFFLMLLKWQLPPFFNTLLTFHSLCLFFLNAMLSYTFKGLVRLSTWCVLELSYRFQTWHNDSWNSFVLINHFQKVSMLCHKRSFFIIKTLEVSIYLSWASIRKSFDR